MTFFDALKNLRSRANNKYLLLGSESFLKEQFIQEAKGIFHDLEFQIYLPEDEEYLESKLSSEDIFDQTLLILIRSYNKMGSKKLPELMEKSSHIIIATISGKSNLKSKSISQCMGFMLPVECVPLSEYGKDYPLWIIRRISSAGYTLEEGADELLYSMTGPSFFVIDNEIRKLFLYKTEDKHITKKDVAAVVSSFSYGSPYDILDNVLRRDKVGALNSFYSYTTNNTDYTGLVLFLVHYMEKMYRISAMTEQKVSDEDIASILRIPRYILRTKYLPKVNNLGRTILGKMYDSLCTLDVQVRQFSGEKKRVLENYLLSV